MVQSLLYLYGAFSDTDGYSFQLYTYIANNKIPSLKVHSIGIIAIVSQSHFPWMPEEIQITTVSIEKNCH